MQIDGDALKEGNGEFGRMVKKKEGGVEVCFAGVLYE